MTGYPSPAVIKRLKGMYPSGTKIALDWMDDPNAPPVGAVGTVFCVDDIGTVHVKWDNGSCLGLVHGEDMFHRI